MQLPGSPYKSMREHIADTIRTAILTGELDPGQRLTEVDLSKRLGASRGPIREALRKLEQEGFVEILPYKETRVSTITLTELKEILVPIRVVVEVFALKRLIQGQDKKLLAALSKVVADMRTSAGSADQLGVIEKDLEFHRVLVQSLKLSHPIRVWSSITPVIYRAFLIGTTPKTLGETVEGHERLLEVIQTGNQEEAERLLKEHIEEMELKFTARDPEAEAKTSE